MRSSYAYWWGWHALWRDVRNDGVDQPKSGVVYNGDVAGVSWRRRLLLSNCLWVIAMANLFNMVSAYPVTTGVVVLVVCWLVVRYFTGRRRRVRDYAKKFDPVDVSTAETVLLEFCIEHEALLGFCTTHRNASIHRVRVGLLVRSALWLGLG